MNFLIALQKYKTFQYPKQKSEKVINNVINTKSYCLQAFINITAL